MMAEFQEVMKQFNRMCEYGKKHPVAGYCGAHCAFEVSCGFDKPNQALRVAMNDPKKFEFGVMKWAAEHPEPVYPTWEEYLRNIGVIPTSQDIIQTFLKIPIPADIAQKLGLKPKEAKA